jgi:hypothetical protein
MNSEMYRAAMSNLSKLLRVGEDVLRKKLRAQREEENRKEAKSPNRDQHRRRRAVAARGERRRAGVAQRGSTTVELSCARSGRPGLKVFRDPGLGLRANPALGRRINCLACFHTRCRRICWLGGIKLHNYPAVYPMDECGPTSFCAGAA